MTKVNLSNSQLEMATQSLLNSAKPSSRMKAFTLIELLVVIGLIAIFSGGVGLALRESSGNALANAQLTVAGLIAMTRAQAAMHQTEARLLVSADPLSAGAGEKYLRQLQVVEADPADTGTWRAVGNPVFLPRGVYVVPEAIDGLLAAGVIWPTTPPMRSNLGSATFNPTVDSVVFGRAHWLEFRSDGSVSTGGSGGMSVRLVLTVGRSENGLPKFIQPEHVRGLVVRPTGAVSFLNTTEDF